MILADKLRDTSPISIRFAEGEIADPTKIDGGFLQADRSAAILEHAVGDIWNSGGDAFLQAAGLTAYALMIPNLARCLGITSLLNPRIPNSSSMTQYTHKVLTADVGNHELQLSLPPTESTSFTWSGTGCPSGSPQTSLSSVNATGEWYVDRTTGWVFTYDDIVADWTVAYAPTVASEMGDDATANIIPDPNTHASYAFQGCKIAYTNNTDNSQGYIIFLPPRGPMSATRRTDRCPQSSYDASGNTANFSSTPGSTPVRMWQSGAVDGTTGTYAEHYRYNLPKIITDNWSASSALPLGLLHLWDPSQTGTTIDGLTFAAENAASPRKYVLIVSGAAIDSWVSSYINTVYAGCGGSACLTNRDDHDPTYYPSGGLRVVTVGNSVSDAISKLSQTFLEHDHNTANSQPGKQVPHSGLSGLFHPTQNISGPTLVPSGLENDDHPQYLHRGGMDSSRDQYRGGMFGDLLLLSTSSASNYQNNSADSNKIVFGSSSGPSIRYSTAEAGILLQDVDKFSLFRDATPSEYFSTYFTGSETVLTAGLNLALMPIASVNLYPLDGYIRFGAVANQNALAIADHYLRFYNQSVSTLAIGEFSSLPYILLGPANGMVMSYDSSDTTLYFEGGGLPGTKTNGKIGCNRIFAGTYDHTSPIDYGEQGGGWGPIRRHVLSPQDFIVADYQSTVDGYVENTQADHFTGYGYSAGPPVTQRGAYALYLPDNGNPTIAWAYINLPFAQYGIVNVLFAIKPHVTVSSGHGNVQIGYSWISAFSSNKPTGTDILTTDFNVLLGVNGRGGSLTGGTWEHNNGFLLASFYTQPSPHIEVSNIYASDAIIAPYVRFYNLGAGSSRHFEFSHVTVLYRVKEW